MTPTLRAAAAAAVLLAALTACSTDEGSGAAKQTGPEATQTSCLVTSDELGEITGVKQEIQEVDVPDGLGATVTCETVVDERGVSLTWGLNEPFIDPPPTFGEQRALVEEEDMVVEETELGSGLAGWVGAGRVFDHLEARVVTLLGDRILNVEANADDEAPVSVSQIKDEALALARAVVAAKGADAARTSPSSSLEPCLVTPAQLEEITGTQQTIQEIPSEGRAEFNCVTTLDDRSVIMQWFVQEPWKNRPRTHAKQRVELDDLKLTVEEVDLGEDQNGWVGAGRPIGYPHAQVNALTDDQWLQITVIAYDRRSPLPLSQIREETLALARAVVAAR